MTRPVLVAPDLDKEMRVEAVMGIKRFDHKTKVKVRSER